MLILTHENADFDAVAAQMAAHKLFPEAIPVLPRYVNRNVEQFLVLYWDALPFLRPQDWRRRREESIVLVDTHTLNSIRGVVRHPKVLVIDHHLSFEHRPGWEYQVDDVGATTTLLVERLQAAGLSLSEVEATLLLLGIYEDSGALTYDTTTSRDAAAAAWLLEIGAKLSVVRRFLTVPLTPGQRVLYERLQEASEWLEVDGQPIQLAVAEAPADYEDEISAVAHRLREAMGPTGLFVLVQLGGDVQLVARSASDAVDVSFVARSLGGGGHSRAAAALIVGQSLASVRQRLVDILPGAVSATTTVAQIMSHGVKTLASHAIVDDALAVMSRYGYEGYPVVAANGHLVGLVTRRAVDRAISHGMGHVPVSRIMRAGSVTVRPGDSVERVQQLMMEEGWGQIPVLAEDATSSDRPIGIVTRTDVLNHLFKVPADAGSIDLRERLAAALPASLWHMVRVVAEVADGLEMPLYFVGGLVRDLLLELPAMDVDMVVEGDAIVLALELQERYGGEVHSHARFGTAKWFPGESGWRALAETAISGKEFGLFLPAGLEPELPGSVDFVTARTEFYTEPSVLPSVERGSIKLDLLRRDFTINTLAIRLDGAHLGQLLDFYGGRRDLEQGVIRVLHSLSFVDDPTRILRAIRLEQRLEFTIEPRTAELIRGALSLLDRITGDRIRHEFELAFRESAPSPMMRRLVEFDVLSHIHPSLEWLQPAEEAFGRLPPLLADEGWRAALGGDSVAFPYFALWMLPLEGEIQNSVMSRLRVRKTTREDVHACAEAIEALLSLGPKARPSHVERALRRYPVRVLLVMRAGLAADWAVDFVDKYYREWRYVKTAVTGHDLRAAGLKPGPIFARLLNRLLAARLDGEIKDALEERALLDVWLREEQAG